jgi:hypothetical protein
MAVFRPSEKLATTNLEPREDKMRFLLTLAAAAIGFAVPVPAQEQNTVDPEVRQQIEALIANKTRRSIRVRRLVA